MVWVDGIWVNSLFIYVLGFNKLMNIGKLFLL